MLAFYLTELVIVLLLAIAGFLYVWNNVFLACRRRYWWFYFRWFLIGRYFCHLNDKQRKVISLIHKLLWSFIVVSCSVAIGQIVEWIVY